MILKRAYNRIRTLILSILLTTFAIPALAQESTETALATIYSVNCNPKADHLFVDTGFGIVVAEVQRDYYHSKIMMFTAPLKDIERLCEIQSTDVPYVRKIVTLYNFDPINGGVLSNFKDANQAQSAR